MNIINRIIFLKDCFFALFLPIVLSMAGLSISAQNAKDGYGADRSPKNASRVNPTTLAMEFSVPLAKIPGRAGNSTNIAVNYSSKVWHFKEISPYAGLGHPAIAQPYYSHWSAAGWSSSLNLPLIDYNQYYRERYFVDPESGVQTIPVNENIPNGTEIFYAKRLRIKMPGGSTVEFRKDDLIYSLGIIGSQATQDITGTFYAVDGSRMRLDLDPIITTLYIADGGRFLFDGYAEKPHTFIDRNGNKTAISEAGQVDTMGREIENPIPFGVGSEWTPIAAQTVGSRILEYPGLQTSLREYTLIWVELDEVLDAGYSIKLLGEYNCGATITGPFSNPLFPSRGALMCGGHTNSNPVVLSKIQFPDGSEFSFKYNSHAEITRINYPTGGYERFEYVDIQPIGSSFSSYANYANRGVKYRWVSEGDGASEKLWTYDATFSPSYKIGTTAPDNSYVEQHIHNETGEEALYGFGKLTTGRVYETRAYSSNEILLSRSLTKWTETGALSTGSQGDVGARRDIRSEREISILFEEGNSNALATMTEVEYDTSGSSDVAYFSPTNPKVMKKYHYVIVSASAGSSTNISTASTWFSSGDVATISEMDYLYDANYKARNISGLLAETRVKDSAGNVKAKTQINYDETNYQLASSGTMPTAASTSWLNPLTELGSTTGAKRALPTTAKRYYDVANGYYIETNSFYDQFGNIRKSRDGRGNASETQYDDDYGFAYPTRSITPIPDSTGIYGFNNPLETSITYDYPTGLPVTITDPNNQVSEIEYSDLLLRPTKITAPNGGETITEYGAGDNISTRWLRVKSQIDDTNWEESVSWLDGLGRTILTQSVDDELDDIYTVTCYDNMGRVSKSSNPVRTGSAPTCESSLEWTTPSYDDLGRTISLTTPDSATIETAYSLAASGNQIGTVVTVEDQAGKQRRSVTNALGQLKRVDEPTSSGLGTISSPNQETAYAYDLLNNLTTVTQGAQTRTFTYDSLSRLKEASNAESGIVKYTYDDNSNLKTKWDARGIKTIYDYDTLNRVWKRCYKSVGTSSLGYTTCTTASGEMADVNTRDVTSYYDNIANGKGRLIKVASSISTTEYVTLDSLGRVTRSKQTTDGVTYGDDTFPMSYTYNIGGDIVEQQYPSGRVVKNTFGLDGSLSQIQSKRSGDTYRNYANAFVYTATGAVSAMRLGNGLWETTAYNSRMQLTQIGLGLGSTSQSRWKLDYEYGATISVNNGNVTKQAITVPGLANPFVQSYTYDELNRISTATETNNSVQTWKQAFTFDRYGNRNFNETQTTTLPKNCLDGSTPIVCPQDVPIVNPSVNTSNNRLNGYEFDSSGNTSEDAEDRTFIYDGENKQVEVKDGSNQTIGQYFYDGDGKRVKKYVPATGETTVFVYDAVGKLIGEYSTIVQTGGQAKITYPTNDHLNSVRVNTDSIGNIISRHDYHPFGEEITRVGYGSDTIRNQFTGYERDSETHLDFAQARMYSNSIGRFSTSDPLEESAKFTDPQTLNRYIYVTNDPINSIDPTGTSECSASFSYEQCGGHMGFWGDSFGDDVAADAQYYGGSSFRSDAFTLHMQRVTNAQSGNGFRTSAEVEAAVAMFETLYDSYYEDDPQSANPRIVEGAITVYQFLPVAWKRLNVYRDVSAGIADNLTFGHYSSIQNAYSQWMYGTSVVNTESSEFQDADTVTAVAMIVLPTPVGKAKVVNVLSKPRNATRILKLAERWLGVGAVEVAPGVFRKGARRMRMTTADLLGKHGKLGSHVHFETLNKAGKVLKNFHVPLLP